MGPKGRVSGSQSARSSTMNNQTNSENLGVGDLDPAIGTSITGTSSDGVLSHLRGNTSNFDREAIAAVHAAVGRPETLAASPTLPDRLDRNSGNLPPNRIDSGRENLANISPTTGR